jgi:hypothetical protein
MLRRVIIAGLSTCVLGLTFGLIQSANATWFDSATGQPVHVTPRGGGNASNDNHATIRDQDGHARDLYWDEACNTWKDSRDGSEVHVTPRGGGNASNDNRATIRDQDGHARDLYWQPCPPPIRTTNIRSNGAFHPFFALEGGGGWSNTNFAVAPPFSVSGSSFVGGINGGVLIDIPGTIFSVGPRIGWQGGNMSGSISGPTASPFFDYSVKTKSIFYQEALVSIPIQRELIGFEKTFFEPGGGQTSLRLPFVTASVGIAELQTQITGISGAFQVIDSANRTGFTGTIGIGIPISQTFLGGEMNAYAQYRGTVLSRANVNIPGMVPIDFWAQGITFGLQFLY